ncbi:MAG: tail fiber domain-containing protein [Patescibacteria group bacterium]
MKKNDFILISQIAKETPYSAEYLSLLVRKSRIAGKKFGRNWAISKSALVEYLQSHQQFVLPQQNISPVVSHFAPLITLASMPEMGERGETKEVKRVEEILVTDVKKELDELEEIYQQKITNSNSQITNKLQSSNFQISNEEKLVPSFAFPNLKPSVPTFQPLTSKAKSYGRGAVQWAEMSIVSILVLGFILGGFNLKFANAIYGAFKNLVDNALTLDGHAPGTHANEVLLLNKGGDISIAGNIETQGQLRSFAPQGVAPFEVDSNTTVPNLSADFLDGLTAGSFDLQLITGNGAVTSNKITLGGGAEILKSLVLDGTALINGTAQFTDYVSLAKDLFVNGKAVISNGLDVIGNSSIIGRLTLKGDLDATGFIAAQRAQIKEGGLTVSGNTQLNSLGVTGGASMSDLGISGNFSVAGKEISLGDSGSDKMTVNASSTFKGPFEVTAYEAKFGRGISILSNGLSVIGASNITGTTSITGNTTITGDLTISGATSFGLNLGLGTTTPGSALGVKGSGIFDGFVSANYFTSTSSLTSWIMGQMGVGTTTPGAEMGIKGGVLSEGFVSADYFTSTSTNTNWFNGALGLGTTTPGSKLAVKGASIIEGFVSADYFTSTSTNSSWIFGNFGIGTTTPGVAFDAKGSGSFKGGLYIQATTTTSSLIATSTLEVRGQSGKDFVVWDGRVGLATDTPGTLLSVHGDANIQNNLVVEGNSIFTGTLKFKNNATTTADGGIEAAGLASSMGLTITGGDILSSGKLTLTSLANSSFTGSVGFGTTTPGAKLAVQGAGIFDGFVSANYFTSTSSLTSWIMGSMGIGTTTPGTRFAVEGDSTIKGNQYIQATTTTSSLIATSTLEVRSSAYTGGNVFAVFKDKVGFGTSTPGSLLSVHGNANIGELTVEGQLKTAFLTSTSTTASFFNGAIGLGTTTPGARLAVQGAGIFDGFVSADYFTSTSTNSSWIFGNFGIGTTTPGTKLAVDGDASVDNFYAMGTTTTSSLIATSTLEVRGTTGNDLVTWNGRVGMGSSTPSSTLTISNDNSNSTKDLLSVVNSVGTYNFVVTNGGSVGIGMYNPSGYLSVYGNTYLAVTEGNVGIGETSPGAKLSVSGGLAVGSSYDTTTVADGNVIISGNVGLGTTTPAKLLQLASTGSAQLMLSDTDAAADLKHWYASSTDGSLSFGSANDRLTSWTERMRIDSNGNLGIGTTTPGNLLDVNGSGNFDSLYTQATSTSSSLIATSTLEVRSSAYTGGNVLAVFKEKVGFGTSTPGSLLSVQGNANIGELTVEGQTKISFLTATSTTNNTFAGALDVTESATSTFTGGINILTTGGLSSATGLTITGGDILSSGKLTLTGASTSTAPQLNVSTILTTPTLEVSTILKNSGTATSTFAGGLVAATGGLSANALNVTGDSLFSGKLTSSSSATSTLPNLNASTIFTTPILNVSTIIKNSGTATSTFDGGLSLGTGGLNITSGGLYVDVGDVTFDQKLVVNGNVGIGTTAPGTALVVSRSASFTSIYNHFDAATDKAIELYSDNAQNLILYQGAFLAFGTETGVTGAGFSEKMRLQTDGNVGIGTTGPVAALQVLGAANKETQIGSTAGIYSTSTYFTDLSTLGSVINLARPSDGLFVHSIFSYDTAAGAANNMGIVARSNIHFVTGATAGPMMTLSSGGNVGIGTTSPGEKLEVSGGAGNGLILSKTTATDGAVGSAGIRLLGGGTNANWYMLTNNSLGASIDDLFFYKGAGTTGVKMTIKDSGNVGIGTANPLQVLSVVGSIRQTGCITAGTLSANTSGDIICTSDSRLKNILGDYTGGLNALSQITPQLFTYKTTPNNPVETFVHAGFIAQNVMTVIPQASALQNDGYYSLDTTAILATTVNAIKEINKVIDIAGAPQSVPSMVVDATGNITLGNTGLAGNVNIVAQCVTGDTRLCRRRKRKHEIRNPKSETNPNNKNSNNFEEYFYDEVAIKDILAGDEVMSLDEETGCVKYARVNGLMDMGVQEVFELVTKSGRKIRTTANHPYLVKLVSLSRGDFAEIVSDNS